MTPQEQAQFNDLKKRVDDLEKKLRYPIDNDLQGTIENAQFKVLKTSVLRAGLPIYTVARADTPKQGEIFLTDIGGTRQICARISGTTYCEVIT